MNNAEWCACMRKEMSNSLVDMMRARKMSCSQLAKLVGIKISNLRRILDGKYAYSIDQFLNILGCFDVRLGFTLNDVSGDDDDELPF